MSEPWIELLRTTCQVRSQTSVARKMGYSVGVVSAVLSGTYKGDWKRVQAAVEGALMNAQVECPVLGTISRARCVEIQRRPFTPTNPLNVTLYRACRSGCPHSFMQPADQVLPSAVQPAVTHNTGSTGDVCPEATSCVVTVPTGRRKRLPHSHSNQGDTP